VGSFLPTVTFYALEVQKTPIWQRVAGAPPWGLIRCRTKKMKKKLNFRKALFFIIGDLNKIF